MGPRGLMDKASDFESEDCEFESRRGRKIIFTLEETAMKIMNHVNQINDKSTWSLQ